MSCKSCKSENGNIFGSEVAIHFPGLSGLDRPVVFVFPDARVCLQCGFSEFAVPQRELTVLKTGRALKGAVVSMDHAPSQKPHQSVSQIQRARELCRQARRARAALGVKLELLMHGVALLRDSQERIQNRWQKSPGIRSAQKKIESSRPFRPRARGFADSN